MVNRDAWAVPAVILRFISCASRGTEELIELLILEPISRHIKDEKIIRSSHHGFIKGKSCLTNLIQFYNEMAVLADEGRVVDIVYLDLSKALTLSPIRSS